MSLTICGADVGIPRGKLIRGGYFANIIDHPHHAYLVIFLSEDLKKFRYCQGSIVHSRWIITAAHCLGWPQPTAIKVRLGVHNLTEDGAIHDVILAKVHPQYSAAKSICDLGLLKTAETIEFGKKIQPLALPESEDRAETFPVLYISGFGRTRLERDPHRRMKLKGFNFTLQPRSVCPNFAKLEGITGKYLCYGGDCEGGITSTCSGDSGAGIFGKRANGTRVALGVHSGGNCDSFNYGLHLPFYIRWVKEIINTFS